jgi:hypothetical protein
MCHKKKNMWNMKVNMKKKKKKNITDMIKELPPISEGTEKASLG